MADQQKLGHTPADNPSMVPWDELPQTMRDSSRDNADHMLLKLAAVGCSVELLTDAVAARFQFTQQEVEQLAIMEHQRWADERLADGWTCAPGRKDAGKKTSPYLVPRKSLSEEIREYDRVVVMGIPLFLAGAGFQVRRLSPAREQKTASLAAPSLAHD